MSINYLNQKIKYNNWLSVFTINQTEQAKAAAQQIKKGRNVYEGFTAPWWFVGALHQLECGGDFSKHLANGDPISAATVNEPVGIPAGTWAECAKLALKRFDWDNDTWNDPLLWLWRAEQYNGFGYAMKDTPSPYLWAGTDIYTKGKYVADGKWDGDAVSNQIGVVAMWKELGIFNPEQAKAAPKESKMAEINIVKTMQQKLILLGLLDIHQDDGKIGNVTRSAMRAAQRWAGAKPNDAVSAADLIVLINPLIVEPDRKIDIVAKTDSPETKLAVKCFLRMRELNCHVSFSNGSDSPSYNICHVEGVSPNGRVNDNQIDFWNDSRVWFTAAYLNDHTIEINGDACAATTGAGWYYRKNPMNSKGCAQIELDKQWFAWRIGLHGSKRYKALVQCRPITVQRDANKDGTRQGDPAETGEFAINIHHGWNSHRVAEHSAGCQVAQNITSHERFMAAIYTDRRVRENPGNIFANITLEGTKLGGIGQP